LNAAAGFWGQCSMPSASDLSYWYLHLPSLLLAALIYLLLVRLILAPVLSAGNPAMRVLAAITNPVVKSVAAITPRVVPPALVVVFAIMWLLSARILLHQAFLARRMFG
jgi:hypothetical protein